MGARQLEQNTASTGCHQKRMARRPLSGLRFHDLIIFFFEVTLLASFLAINEVGFRAVAVMIFDQLNRFVDGACSSYPNISVSQGHKNIVWRSHVVLPCCLFQQVLIFEGPVQVPGAPRNLITTTVFWRSSTVSSLPAYVGRRTDKETRVV
jgi:hypothetical protein